MTTPLLLCCSPDELRPGDTLVVCDCGDVRPERLRHAGAPPPPRPPPKAPVDLPPPVCDAHWLPDPCPECAHESRRWVMVIAIAVALVVVVVVAFTAMLASGGIQ
jgi:hypothetical protein